MASKSNSGKKPAKRASKKKLTDSSGESAKRGGVSQNLQKFLRGLAKNNNRPWFDAHREQYEAARLEFTSFVRELIERIAEFDPLVRGVDVHSCLFRIHRDVRFSRDKTPYKAHFSAFIAKDGKKSKYPGYYIHIEPGENMAAGGIYHPLPENLALLRAKAAEKGSSLKKILDEPVFKKAFPQLEGDRLKSPPRTYSKEHPHADLLCMKDFIVVSKIKDQDLSGNLMKTALSRFRLMLPFQKWLADAVV